MDRTKQNELKRVSPDGSTKAVAAGTSVVTSDAIDTAGYEGARIILEMGTITSGAVTTAEVQECATSDGSYTAIAGSSQTIADTDDDKLVVWDVQRPRARYLKVVTRRATQNAVIDGLVVELYGGRLAPVTQGATVLGVVALVSTAEGTA